GEMAGRTCVRVDCGRAGADSRCAPTPRVGSSVRAPELRTAGHRSKSAATPERAMTEDHHRGPASTLWPRDQVTGVFIYWCDGCAGQHRPGHRWATPY